MAGSLMLLPSCAFIDWLKEKFGGTQQQPAVEEIVETETVAQGLPAVSAKDDSPILATMNGKPLITKNMLDAEKKKLVESNPQLQAMIALMDEKQLDRNLVDGMVSREVIRKYIGDNKIDASEKYKKDFDMVINQVRDALNTRYFMEAFTVSVSDGEIKKFYDDNKESIPNLLVSSGGVESKGLSFTDAAQANEFAIKVRANKNDIARTARETGISGRLKDFKLVNNQSIGIEPALRDKIVDIKSTPSVHTFNVGKEYWVVAANKIEKPQYRELDQVKDDLRQLLEKDKTMKKFEEEVVRLRDQYRMELNEEFFNGKVDNAQAVQADASFEKDEITPVKAPTSVV
jgi:hypothetical protein